MLCHRWENGHSTVERLLSIRAMPGNSSSVWGKAAFTNVSFRDVDVRGWSWLSMNLCTQTITATPRQLESLVRIGEALARMRLSPTVEREDAAEALRLMQVCSLI